MGRVLSIAVCLTLAAVATPVGAHIELVAKGSIPGDAKDLSGLTDSLSDGTPHNRLGSMGSGIAYTGRDNLYILVADRGPSDGSVPYRCRFQSMEIKVKGKRLEATLQATTTLTDERGKPLVGWQGEIGKAGMDLARFDPEGVRVSRKGTVYISDEYGPFIYEFDLTGKRLASVPVPQRFQLAHPRTEAAAELADNRTGRVPNRGMEGLAITPDGSKLVGIMQSPLIQDGGRKGTNVRVLELDLASHKTREFLYTLEGTHTGVSEILAINATEFLVLERDGGKRTKAPFRKIFKIDLSRATEISAIDTLPKIGVPADVTPVSKHLFLDFLDPRFGLAGPEMPVKIEGLAFGPDLADGRRLLLVTTDNDFHVDEPTWIFAFGIDHSDLPTYVPQAFGR
jgi:hypothetical protein